MTPTSIPSGALPTKSGKMIDGAVFRRCQFTAEILALRPNRERMPLRSPFSRIFEPRNSHRGQATLAEKAQCRLNVCVLDTLVFCGREHYARECLPDFPEHGPLDLGVSAPLVAKCGIVFGDSILVHRSLCPRPSVTSISFIN
jgi:hypothetical protein